MTKETVAHLCNEYLPPTCTFIYAFLRNMKTYEPIVLANNLSNLGFFPLEHIISIPHPSLANRVVNRVVRMNGYFRTSQYRFYEEVLKRERAVLIHAHFGEIGFGALELSRGLKLPLVTSFYGADLSLAPRSWYWKKAYRRLFAEGDFFLTFSRKMKSMLVELGCSPGKIETCPSGVDVKRIPLTPRRLEPAEEIRILLCNRFVEKKGTEYAIKAFAMLRARVPNCRLILIGDGPLKKDLMALVSRLAIGPFVDFLGVQLHPRVIDELLKAHIFLSPSVRARDGDDEGGINYIVVEAAATGIPLVVTEHASSEVVFEGISGLVAQERDEIDLFEKLLFLVNHPSCWEGLGRQARMFVESQFLASTQAQKLEKIYAEQIARAGNSVNSRREGR